MRSGIVPVGGALRSGGAPVSGGAASGGAAASTGWPGGAGLTGWPHPQASAHKNDRARNRRIIAAPGPNGDRGGIYPISRVGLAFIARGGGGASAGRSWAGG